MYTMVLGGGHVMLTRYSSVTLETLQYMY